MKRKRDIMTRAIIKYKARLNIDGSRIKKGLHYEETYAPVAKWNSIRILLTLTWLHYWKTTQLDYVLAFPQAPVEKELYMEIPKGFEGAKGEFVLQLYRNVYGQKQAGRVWNQINNQRWRMWVYCETTTYKLFTEASILVSSIY